MQATSWGQALDAWIFKMKIQASNASCSRIFFLTNSCLIEGIIYKVPTKLDLIRGERFRLRLPLPNVF